MMWTAILVALAVSVAVFAYSRCRRANQLIDRILTEELGALTPDPAPRPFVAQTLPPQVPLQKQAA